MTVENHFQEAEDWIRSHDLPVHFVYALLNSDGEALYVGTTKDAYKRLRQHKTSDLASRRFDGLIATPVILDAGLTESEAYQREQERYDELHPKYNKTRPARVRRPGPQEDHL